MGSNNDKLAVAKVGRTMGVRGHCKLHLLCDFPEQFVPGASFQTSKEILTIEAYDPDRGEVRFRGYDTLEKAKVLVNRILFTTKEASEAALELEEGEFFWYQVIGCAVAEEGETLGEVADIERYPTDDMLVVRTAPELVKTGLPQSFLLPYNDRYVIGTDVEGKLLTVRYAKEILEAS